MRTASHSNEDATNSEASARREAEPGPWPPVAFTTAVRPFSEIAFKLLCLTFDAAPVRKVKDCSAGKLILLVLM